MRAASRKTPPPAPLTRFIGRVHEQAKIRGMVARERLVTVVGPGGVGKTRLALAVADGLVEEFDGEVAVADLAAVVDPLLAGAALGSAVGLDDRTGIATAAVAAFVSDRRVLLLVDNCEHLLPDVGEILRALLEACPGLQVLATSRAALGVAGEAVVVLGPLPVPSESIDLAVGSEGLASFDAVALFSERAAAAGGFTLTPANAGAVVALCRRLDGLPLALELAASRLRAFGIENLLGELDRRIDVLRAPHSRERRQDSAVASLDWSYELLSDPARALWRRLAVFPGGATIEDVRAVCAGGVLCEGEGAEHLAELVDHSILVRDHGELGSRYRMLEVLRAYAGARLEAAGERDAVLDGLRDHILGWAERAAWFGPDQLGVLARLEAEQANIIAVLEDALARPQAAAGGLALAGHLARWWTSRGHLSEGRHYLHKLLERVSEPSWDRYNALGIAGILAIYEGDLAGAEQWLRAQMSVGEAAGILEPATEANLAAVRLARGDLASARELARAAPERPGFPRDDWEFVHCTEIQARVAIASGELPYATTLLKEALDRCERSNERWYRQRVIEGLGQCAVLDGRLEEAARLFEDGVSSARELGDWRGLAAAAEGLARVAIERGECETAARVLGASQAGWQLPGALPDWWAARHASTEAKARAALGDRRYEELFAVGLRMTVTDAWSGEPRAILRGQAASVSVRQHDRDELSPRELQVLRLLSAPVQLREIAAELFVSPNTLKSHCKSLYRKLGVSSREAAVTRARDAGLIG